MDGRGTTLKRRVYNRARDLNLGEELPRTKLYWVPCGGGGCRIPCNRAMSQIKITNQTASTQYSLEDHFQKKGLLRTSKPPITASGSMSQFELSLIMIHVCICGEHRMVHCLHESESESGVWISKLSCIYPAAFVLLPISKMGKADGKFLEFRVKNFCQIAFLFRWVNLL